MSDEKLLCPKCGDTLDGGEVCPLCGFRPLPIGEPADGEDCDENV